VAIAPGRSVFPVRTLESYLKKNRIELRCVKVLRCQVSAG
jgi:hypothetical protein